MLQPTTEGAEVRVDWWLMGLMGFRVQGFTLGLGLWACIGLMA